MGEEKRTEIPQTQEEQDIQEWENPDDRRRLTEDVILDMLDHKQYKELKEELEITCTPWIWLTFWKNLTRSTW